MKAPKKTLLTTALLAAPALVSALGLGSINVKSGLNEPLVAEIPVSVNSVQERDSLTVMQANADDYARVGIDASRSAVPIEFSVVNDNRGGAVIRVTSSEAIREPFLQLLLEVNWNRGKLLREYSVLLDPPVMAPALRGQAATTKVDPPAEIRPEVTEAAPMTKPVETAVIPEPVVEPEAAPEAKPQNRPVPVESAPAAEATTPDSHTIRSGDTLWVIANSSKPSTASVDQMMVAILRKNPQAFNDGNINALKKGAILRMPNKDELDQISLAEASRVIREQNSLWRSYQAQSAASPVSVADPGTSSVSAPSAPATNGARIELVPPANGSANAKALSAAQADAARAKEDLLSAQREAQDSKERISELEKIKSDQERALALKDQQLKDLQDQLAKVNAMPATPPAETSVVEAAPISSAVATDPTAPAASISVADPIASEASAPAASDDIWGEPAASTASIDAGTPVVDDPSVTGAGTEVAPVVEPSITAEPVVEPSAPVASAAPSTTDWPEVDTTPWWKTMPAMIGAGAGVLGLLGFLLMRKKKPAVASPVIAQSYSDDVNFGIPAIGAGAALNQSFAAQDEDEARIQSAIAGNPNDLWSHLDLLRLYYSRQDANNFEAAASTMFGFVMDPESPQWQEARSMGAQLVPNSSLFAAADFNPPSFDNFSNDFAPSAPVVQVPSMPVTAQAPAVADEPLGSLDLSAFDDAPAVAKTSADDFSFDLSLDTPTQVVAPVAAAASGVAGSVAAAKDDFAFDFNFDAPQAVAPKLPALDDAPALTGFDSVSITDVVPAPLESNGDADDLMIGDDSVGTKLDLAKAYLDMGDPDGARSMLEEVLGEGTDAQRAEAKSLLSRLT